MALVLFVSEDYLKSFSVINDNVEMKQITPLIEKVQEQRILPAIGTALYEQLKTQIQASTLTALNTTLLDDYIAKAVLWWTMYEAPIFFNYRFMNKGVMVKSSDNSRPIGMDEVNDLRGQFKNDAEFYTNRIVLYLIENASSYPLYDNPGDGVDTVVPQGYSYSNGIYLGDDTPANGLPTDWGRKYNC